MNNEWEKFGKEIRNIVEDAVNAQDFRQLNRTITNSINDAVSSIQEGLKTAGETVNQAFSQPFQERMGKGFSQPFPEHGGKAGSQPSQGQGQQKEWEAKYKGNNVGSLNVPKAAQRPELFKKNTSVKAGGVALAAFG